MYGRPHSSHGIPLPWHTAQVIIERERAWLVDSGSSHHVCNDYEMMWDIKHLDEPILLLGLLGENKITQEGTVKLECWDKDGNSTELHLLNTLRVPRAKTNLFSMQIGRKAGFRIVQDQWKPDDVFNDSSLIDSKGRRVGRIREDPSGRGTLFCNVLMPPSPPDEEEITRLEGLAAALANPEKWAECNNEWKERNKKSPEFPFCDGADPSLSIMDQVISALRDLKYPLEYERETLGWQIFSDAEEDSPEDDPLDYELSEDEITFAVESKEMQI